MTITWHHWQTDTETQRRLTKIFNAIETGKSQSASIVHVDVYMYFANLTLANGHATRVIFGLPDVWVKLTSAHPHDDRRIDMPLSAFVGSGR